MHIYIKKHKQSININTYASSFFNTFTNLGYSNKLYISKYIVSLAIIVLCIAKNSIKKFNVEKLIRNLKEYSIN